MDIAELLTFSVKNGASDLHLSAGMPPMIRVDGDMRKINIPVLDHKTVHGLVYDIMNDKQRKDYEEFFETDFSFEIPDLARFRVNAFNHNRGAGGVFRTIPSEILALEDLGTPQIFKDIADTPLLAKYCKENNIPQLPFAISHSHVCRDDLLFEIELDAIAVS